MRLRKLCVGFLVFAACVGFAQTHPRTAAQKPSTKPEFALRIAAPNHPFSLSGPVNIFITATNITNHTIGWSSYVGKESKYVGFRYDLERDGHPVETTFFNRYLSGRNRTGDPVKVLNGSYILLPHAPGRMFQSKIDLKLLFHISEPGKYTFQVSRYDTASKTTVRSNIIDFTIGP